MKLIVAVTTRALFDLDKEDALFHEQGEAAFVRYQIRNQNRPIAFGTAYPLVSKLLELNKYLPEPMVEVCLLSRNDPASGLRISATLEKTGLAIDKRIFTSGKMPFQYLKPLKANLFLSANAEDVTLAIQSGFAAATVLPWQQQSKEARLEAEKEGRKEVRIAFDGDCVLFGDESERVFIDGGRDVDTYHDHEKQHKNTPLSAGPMKQFLKAVHDVQRALPPDAPMKLNTCLVTARCAPADQRPILTLRKWGIMVNQALFLGGMQKSAFLEVLKPDIFFDDHYAKYCVPASKVVPSAHVSFGPTMDSPNTGVQSDRDRESY